MISVSSLVPNSFSKTDFEGFGAFAWLVPLPSNTWKAYYKSRMLIPCTTLTKGMDESLRYLKLGNKLYLFCLARFTDDKEIMSFRSMVNNTVDDWHFLRKEGGEKVKAKRYARYYQCLCDRFFI
jgi:hypothetical protein